MPSLYLSITTPLEGDTFEVLSVRGEEHISAPFRYMVEMGSHDLKVDFTQVLGKPVTIGITHEDETKHTRNGIVARFTQKIDGDNHIVYTAEVVPWLWLLTRSSDCRIFQNKTVPEIIKTVFSDLGHTAFKDSLTKTYESREYCVQYHETHFDFVSRLMEDEGIFYFFTHGEEHTLVLADDMDAHAVCPGLSAAVHFTQFAASWDEEDAVDSCTLEEQVVTREYRMTDYNFETPATKLDVAVDATTPDLAGKPSLMEYPGGYMVKDKGDARAKVRIELHELAMKMIRGGSNSRHFIAGHKFTLSKHFREALNADYVLRSVVFTAEQNDYRNTFIAFPATVPFRPDLTTKKPAIHGYQLATITGKSGEEIWTDKYGRVKVSFPWDSRSTNDENSSCWIRVAQPWAGKAWGTISIPRVGTEVLVSFLDGDPDRPIIMGTLFNAMQTVPYTLPDEATKTAIKTNSSKGGEGFNELRFEDKKGSEQVFIHGEKDFDLRVKNDAKEWYGNDHHIIVTKNQYNKVSEERHTLVTKDDVTKIDGERHLKLAKDDVAKIDGERDVTITKDDKLKIAGAMHLTVTGDINEKSDGNVSVNAAQNLYQKSGMNHGVDAGQEIHLKGGMNVVIEAGMSVTLKAGGGFIVVGPAGVTISGTPVMINSGGSAGSGGGCSPTAPEAPKDPKDITEPKEADNAEPGGTTTASGGGAQSGSESSGGGGSSSGGSSGGGSTGGESSSSESTSSTSEQSTAETAQTTAAAQQETQEPAAAETATEEPENTPEAVAQAETLKKAAENGTPFCEECEKLKKEQEAQAASSDETAAQGSTATEPA